MISEKNIAGEFKGFWNESLPLLIPSFVRVFNEASMDDLTEYAHSKMQRIPIGKDVEKHDLVAEFSFQIAKWTHDKSYGVEILRQEPNCIIEPYEKSIKFLQKYKNEEGKIVLNEDEITESIDLAEQYEYFLEHLGSDDIEFSPTIVGAGFLGRCKADLSVGDTLYEIKTVSRNISGKDIKQLLIYLALQYSTGQRRWKKAGFYNPRKAQHYKFSVDHLIHKTSGGKATAEFFSDIVDFLSSRGVELDTAF
ncbi:MAG: hypothetical protein G3M78_01770 [Candidatus Nitrohelix vancouverensis]|uniref:PD-(D/E)XK endonuclease-like domain-containing protein n=1 Tax=Candidatus Nitrohelix vancouverensis TaxID=2705534 RepID=A0A7T0C0L7_9BACT|nr:MAG: hypothetical protein G3M78_01770 [Candidatus Nitrohelix vancouverensis]